MKAAGPDTDGAFMVVEYVLNADIPPHIHLRQHESFYVLEGALTVLVGDEEFDAGLGDFVFLPSGVPHAITATSNSPPTLLAIATPHASSGGVWPVPLGAGESWRRPAHRTWVPDSLAARRR